MSASSRAIDTIRRFRRIDGVGPMAERPNASPPFTSVRGETAAVQEGLGRECLTQHLRSILPLALPDLAVLSVAFLCSCKLVAYVSGVPFAGQTGHLAALITTAVVLYGSLGLFQNRTFQALDEFRQIVLWQGAPRFAADPLQIGACNLSAPARRPRQSLESGPDTSAD
jgi:hypothetical protein